MKKLYLTEMETGKRNEIIKKNQKLIKKLLSDLYEMQMFQQEDAGRCIFGNDQDKFIEIKDHYNSFYLVLKDWRKFIDTVEEDYYSPNAIKLNEETKKLIEQHDNMEQFTDEYYEIEDKIENNCKILLEDLENYLHEFEEYPDEDDAIRYAEEMEQLEGYYIEVREDGTTDNVIRLAVSYIETFI